MWSQGRTLPMWLWGLKCVDKDTGKTFGFNEMIKAKWLYFLNLLLTAYWLFDMSSVKDIVFFETVTTANKYTLPTQILSFLMCIDELCVFAYDGATLFESMAGAQVVVRPGKTVQIKGN